MLAIGLEEGFAARQRAFGRERPDLDLLDPDAGTAVVLPSLSVSQEELQDIKGIQFYEERLLSFLLALRRPGMHVAYLTSLPVDPAIVDYYLSFLPDQEDARRRLLLVALADDSHQPLTAKLLDRPDVLEAVRAFTARTAHAWLIPFAVTDTERALAELTGLPIYGPPPRTASLGSKSGSRRAAKSAGVPVLDGHEDLRSLADVERALTDLARRLGPSAPEVLVKLDDSYSGLGNAIVNVGDPGRTGPDAPTRFCSAGESWSSYSRKIAARGAIVEEFVRAPGVCSPSALLRITPGGSHAVVATHDQILGGTDSQVYVGCRFPADARYRAMISECAERVASVLAAEGVIGLFGIDFLVVPSSAGERVVLCEINLRLGGTTHPLGMTLHATGATYGESGQLVAGGISKCYVATDNLTSPSLAGQRPTDVIGMIDAAGLAFDPGTGIGVTLHMLGAVPMYGKLGLTCIADSPADAGGLYAAAADVCGAGDRSAVCW